MTEKRFTYLNASKNHYIGSFFCNGAPLTNKEVVDLLNENEQLKQDIENLKTTLRARETLIDVCEKKFRELGYIITVDDDGYVIE